MHRTVSRRALAALCALVGVMLCVSASRAEVVFTGSGGGSQIGTGFTYGFRFTPVQDISVTHLGYIDVGQDGLSNPHPVGIWNLSGSLLSSASVTTANSTLDGPVMEGNARYRFTPIGPLSLDAGTTYVFGASSGAPSPDGWYAGGSNISNAPHLATVSTIGYFNSGSFSYPDLTIGNTYNIGSFIAVPEPAGLGLCAALGTMLMRRGRRLYRPHKICLHRFVG
jgi:hypothetical protein